jgi:hypothetical protein
MQASTNIYSISAVHKPFTGFAEIRYEDFPPNHMETTHIFRYSYKYKDSPVCACLLFIHFHTVAPISTKFRMIEEGLHGEVPDV